MWLTVGRAEPQKDYGNLVAAFRLVAKAEAHARLVIVGRETDTIVRKMIERENLTSRCLALGQRHDVPSLVAAADAFVLASAWEGLPNSVMEAAAAGTPIVATQVGGVPELVEDGTTGFLVPPAQPDAIARAMLDLMRLSPAARQSMGERARRLVTSRYSCAVVVQQWEELFLTLMGEKSSRV